MINFLSRFGCDRPVIVSLSPHDHPRVGRIFPTPSADPPVRLLLYMTGARNPGAARR